MTELVHLNYLWARSRQEFRPLTRTRLQLNAFVRKWQPYCHLHAALLRMPQNMRQAPSYIR